MEPNKSIMGWLGIASPFWHGDVSMLKYSEDPATVRASLLDCPARLLDGEMIRRTLQQDHPSNDS
ncbi:hypothetical protein PspLS_00143 [Pyricularia sp. CBS 133598]|nr:hypothetical protein PspLS_00143 [Pyricularia sp. CBS 133598]